MTTRPQTCPVPGCTGDGSVSHPHDGTLHSAFNEPRRVGRELIGDFETLGAPAKRERSPELDALAGQGCICGGPHDPNPAHYPKSSAYLGVGSSFETRDRTSPRNTDENWTTTAIDKAGETFAARIKGLHIQDLVIKPAGGGETFQAIDTFLRHSNLQAVIDHVVGLVETLNADVAKALVRSDTEFGQTVARDVENVRAAAEAAIKRVEASLLERNNTLAGEVWRKGEQLEKLEREVAATLEATRAANVALAETADARLAAMTRTIEHFSTLFIGATPLAEGEKLRTVVDVERDVNSRMEVFDSAQTIRLREVERRLEGLRAQVVEQSRNIVAVPLAADQTLSEVAALKGMVADLERRLTDSNKVHAAASVAREERVIKLERWQGRIANRLGIELREKVFGEKVRLASLGAPWPTGEPSHRETTFRTLMAGGEISHWRNTVGIEIVASTHPASERCVMCAMAGVK